MKAEELRIGNLLLFYDRVRHINAINIQDFQNELDGQVKEVNYKPIPLNEEWLIKFGFISYDSMFIGDCWGRRDKHYAFYISKESMRFGHPQFNLEIKHVHQLQNLYFALTGEELKINESIEVN